MLTFHTHDGINTPRIDPKNLLGFPIFNSTPTHTAEEGTPVFVNDSGTVLLYVMINRVWNLIGAMMFSNAVTLNFGAILPNSSADLTMALVGAVDGDSITLGVQDAIISTGTNCNNISFFAWVSAPDVVTVRCVNNSAVNTANPASGLFRATVTQF